MPATRSVAALLLASIALIAIPCHAKDDEWVEVRSPHFSVVSDAGDRRAREVALRFEQMYYVFGTLFSKKIVNLPVPLQIIAFRNTRELRDFVPLWHGKPIQVAGLYQGGEDRNFILLDLSVEDPYRVVFHEYGHYETWRFCPLLPTHERFRQHVVATWLESGGQPDRRGR